MLHQTIFVSIPFYAIRVVGILFHSLVQGVFFGHDPYYLKMRMPPSKLFFRHITLKSFNSSYLKICRSLIFSEWCRAKYFFLPCVRGSNKMVFYRLRYQDSNYVGLYFLITYYKCGTKFIGFANNLGISSVDSIIPEIPLISVN